MPFVAGEWFRSPAWDDAACAGFEARLARARPHNRQQYLRVKAVSLRAAGNNHGARELLERAADYPGGHLHETVFAWEMLADIAVEHGDRATAGQLYRRILAKQPTLSCTTGSVEMSLAEILLDTGCPQGPGRGARALEVLDRPRRDEARQPAVPLAPGSHPRGRGGAATRQPFAAPPGPRSPWPIAARSYPGTRTSAWSRPATPP